MFQDLHRTPFGKQILWKGTTTRHIIHTDTDNLASKISSYLYLTWQFRKCCRNTTGKCL